MSVEEKNDSISASRPIKRPKLDSQSSDSGLVQDGESEIQGKRAKLEDINESSPKTSSTDATAE